MLNSLHKMVEVIKSSIYALLCCFLCLVVLVLCLVVLVCWVGLLCWFLCIVVLVLMPCCVGFNALLYWLYALLCWFNVLVFMPCCVGLYVHYS